MHMYVSAIVVHVLHNDPEGGTLSCCQPGMVAVGIEIDMLSCTECNL